MSRHPNRVPHRTGRTVGHPRRRAGSAAGALALLLLLSGTVPRAWAVAAPFQESQRVQDLREGEERPSGPAGYAGSRWWPLVLDVDASLGEERWKRALHAAEDLLDQVVRRSWEEPDLKTVLATLSVQRAVAEAALGRKDAALWHWYAALNLDPSVEAKLDDYGEAADLLRGVPLRLRGRLPDGTVPPTRFTTPGYEPVTVVRPPSIGLFENASVRGRQLRPVSLEVVVGENGRLHQPLVTSPWVHPVVVYWTLERCFSADYEVRPARIDGRPIVDLADIEMEFETSDRW